MAKELSPESNALKDLDLNRRDFLAAGATAMALTLIDGPAVQADDAPKVIHRIPTEKTLKKQWLEELFNPGKKRIYRGEALKCIGMPVGGIAAGQVYLRGDGTLAYWDIFNIDHNTGYGDTCYRTFTPDSPLDQGFAIWAKSANGDPVYANLDHTAFPDLLFTGQYPVAEVDYNSPAGKLPVRVSMKAFSPFIPLNAKESATPGVCLQFTVHNPSAETVEVSLVGWLQNIIGRHQLGRRQVLGRIEAHRTPQSTHIVLTAEEKPLDPQKKIGEPEVFADFESGTYGVWKKTGLAFGDAPARGTLPNQQPVTGFGGKFLVNSFAGGDQSIGTLTSPEFTIKRPYINFKIGGGNHPGKACINLKVDDKMVRTATGKNDEKLEWEFWEVSQFLNKKAVIEIIDMETGGWGHINIDDIQFADEPPKELKLRPFNEERDIGTMVLAVVDPEATVSTGWSGGIKDGAPPAKEAKANVFPIGEKGSGALAAHFKLGPNEKGQKLFLITWHFPNHPQGHAYAGWYKDARDVADYLTSNFPRLEKQTEQFRNLYYETSTLPQWLLERLMMPVSTLATNTVQWWKNGRFWAWEGVGCCHGTCAHVWNYAQAVAHLFPGLERSARTMQDLGPAMDPKTGRVAFRGEGPGFQYAADGQCGTVLKCYREHLMSKDGAFLKANWPRIKLAMQYSISRDGNDDGVIEDNQHNTYDIDFVGPNTFVGGLYLAALEAAARMSDLQGDNAFAKKCRTIASKGREWTVKNLWNGEYFIQRIPPKADTKFQYGEGCLADQLFGQTWAYLLQLGYIYPSENVHKALQSIYRYNWATDLKAQNMAFPPQRWFARPGEAGLFTCTWPKGGRMREPVLYRDEIWTGIEYQVATSMIFAGMVTEALAIIRGLDERYDGVKHNPWNEVECGDHYARAMASWGCYLALTGFFHNGPAQQIGMTPRFRPEDMRAFYCASQGWGQFTQKRGEKSQVNELKVDHGKVVLKELFTETPEKTQIEKAELKLKEKTVAAKVLKDGNRTTFRLEEPLVLGEGDIVSAQLEWGIG